MKFIIITLILLSLSFHQLNAQIFGGIMNEAKRKLERKIEDKIIQAVSDELVKRAFRPVEQSIDSLLREKYQDSIAQGDDVDWEKVGTAYGEFLNGMNKAVDLPDKYTFDVTQEIEITDYDKKKNNIKLHYSKKDTILAMENIDDEKSKSIVVIDIAKDAMIMYTIDKKGKKTGQVVPSVLKFTQSISSASTKNTKDDLSDFKVQKTGKSKKIAGYNSDEYKGNSSKEEITMYLSTNFPINTQKTMQAYLSKLAPPSYNENMTYSLNGIMLESENMRLDEKGEKTTWKTKKISEKSFDIVNIDYGL
jgi:hypothetical protein